ncbi:MAG: hypothetical protein R3190_11925, partial [Thermoanaerobaculia bacterium]|nr:hypothetical protein [Thermoanaerobaculia bacterium]
VKPDGEPPVIEHATVSPDPFIGPQNLAFRVGVSDPDGLDDIDQVLLYVFVDDRAVGILLTPVDREP